ncbi:MAG: 5'-3' exonuclease [Microgenomates group bacterium]
MKTLLLIDGNAIMHRAYHALPSFKTKKGFPTNAIFGFFSILNKVIKDFQPNYLVVCFDTPVPTFRKKIFKEYQAQRPKVEDELAIQFKITKEALDKGGIFHLEKEGYEADDLIGTIVAKYKNNKDLRILILSGDRDILQLVDKNVFVITPQIGFSKSKIYNEEEVSKKFKIKPYQIVDYKALIGDVSDNYPGAKGIGPKTAVKLINQFTSIENIYKNLDLLNEKLRKILTDNKENIDLSFKLAKIVTDVPVDISLPNAAFGGFKEELRDFLLQYEIKAVTERIFNNNKKDNSDKPKKVKDSLQSSLF